MKLRKGLREDAEIKRVVPSSTTAGSANVSTIAEGDLTGSVKLLRRTMATDMAQRFPKDLCPILTGLCVVHALYYQPVISMK